MGYYRKGENIMPRKERTKSKNDIYHIMIRGVNKKIIFYDNKDKEKFLQLITYYKSKYFTEIYAYCLMDNHVHLLIKSENNINKFMQCIETVYAMYFNKKYKRVGHLFQDRYRSIAIENDKYLLECIRYIHKNPVKAKISSMENYKWSSYNEYIGKSRIINSKYILSFFLIGNNKTAITNYINYMNKYNISEDIKNLKIEDKINDKDAIELIEKCFKLNINNIKKNNATDRNSTISKMLMLDILSISQISRITGINRNIIRKIKEREWGPKRV